MLLTIPMSGPATICLIFSSPESFLKKAIGYMKNEKQRMHTQESVSSSTEVERIPTQEEPDKMSSSFQELLETIRYPNKDNQSNTQKEKMLQRTAQEKCYCK